MKRAFKIAGAVLALLLVFPLVVILTTFVGNPKIPDGLELASGARVVNDGYVATFMVPTGDGSLALIDCGNDASGKALLAELERRKLPRDAVKAIFVTHGHPDHIKGCPLFPAAQIYALETERGVIEGREKTHGPVTKLFPARDLGVRVTRALKDGETVAVGPLQVTVFAVPGHTRGSAAYLAGGVLYLGDSADAKKDGTLVGSKYWFSDDKEQNQASLHALATRLASRADEIKTLAFAHTGVLPGFAPLRDFR